MSGKLKNAHKSTKRLKTHRTKITRAVHETAEGLHRVKLLDAKTMREFDVACLKEKRREG
jgi:putative transcriptional regulator